MFSVPIESLMVFGLMFCSANSSAVHWLCVVVAGWITNDLTSATFASRENNSRLSMKSFAFFSSPLISNVKIEPPPFGKYFAYSACCFGSSDTDGWCTFSTCGWLSRYFTTFSAFSTWRSTRRDRVSSPCRSRKELNGERVAPVSLSRIARIFVTNAAGPTASVKDTPW